MRAAAWGPQIAAFQGRRRVIALDLPGHGRSAPLAGEPGLPDFVDWLDAALDALGAGPVDLAGHSMGALICGGLAIAHPDRVRRVALLNCVNERSPEARAAVEARAARIAEGQIDLTAPVRRWFRDTPEDRRVADEALRWLSEVPPDGYAQAYRAFATGDDVLADGWGRIACPLLALTADGDPNSTPEMSRAIAAAAPDGEAVVIEGHRHMVGLTDPSRVNAELARLLARPAGAPS